MVKVHIWWPDIKGNIGHGSALVRDTYISNWPGELSSVFLAGKGQLNTYEQDVSSEGGPPGTVIYISDLDESAMITWWQGFQRNPHYSLWALNCIQTVATALCIGSPNPLYTRHLAFTIGTHFHLWAFANKLS